MVRTKVLCKRDSWGIDDWPDRARMNGVAGTTPAHCTGNTAIRANPVQTGDAKSQNPLGWLDRRDSYRTSCRNSTWGHPR
jgi:hypothetical protein